MHRTVVRKKAQRRSYLKRFMSDTIHIHQRPLGAPFFDKAQTEEQSIDKFQTFALSARNKAAKSTHDNPLDIFKDGRYDKVWAAESRAGHGIDAFNSIVLEQGRYNYIRYYFSGDEHFIIEVKQLYNVIRRSVIYRSRTLLTQAMGHTNVIWAHSQKLTPK